MMIRWNFRCKN